MHRAVRDTELRALVRTSHHANVRIKLPTVRSAVQVEEIGAGSGGLAVGAMVETPEAIERIDESPREANGPRAGRFTLSLGLGNDPSRRIVDWHDSR